MRTLYGILMKSFRLFLEDKIDRIPSESFSLYHLIDFLKNLDLILIRHPVINDVKLSQVKDQLFAGDHFAGLLIY